MGEQRRGCEQPEQQKHFCDISQHACLHDVVQMPPPWKPFGGSHRQRVKPEPPGGPLRSHPSVPPTPGSSVHPTGLSEGPSSLRLSYLWAQVRQHFLPLGPLGKLWLSLPQ